MPCDSALNSLQAYIKIFIEFTFALLDLVVYAFIMRSKIRKEKDKKNEDVREEGVNYFLIKMDLQN